MSTTAPSFTFNAAGNIRSSASLGAGATDNANVDYSAVMEAIVTVKNTPGGSVAATRGVRVDVFNRHGSSPTTGDSATLAYTLPSTRPRWGSARVPGGNPGQVRVRHAHHVASVVLRKCVDG
jgi:hypothetical protein